MNSDYIAAPDELILVTGANGFIGTKVVETFLEYGFANFVVSFDPAVNLPVLRRRSASSMTARMLSLLHVISFPSRLPKGSRRRFNDLSSRRRDGKIICRCIHEFGAGYSERDICVGKPKRFVNVSSFAVYSTLSLKHGAPPG